MKQLTRDFINSEFTNEGYELLTKEYINAFQKLQYICPNGHNYSISWGSWQQGRRCKLCATEKGAKKLRTSLNFIKLQFEREGYKLLTEKYLNAFQKLKYICPSGHNGTIIWNSWQQGRRCRACGFAGRIGANSPNWKGGYNARKIPLYDHYASQINFCEETRRSPNDSNILQVRCTESGCRRWFTPNLWSVINRIRVLNGYPKGAEGEQRFYCSDKCKQTCSIYNQKKYPKGFEPTSYRPNQKEWANLVLKRDGYECIICNSKEKLKAHHIKGIYQDPTESADIDKGITLCNECHILVHRENGCRPVDLQRNNLCRR